MGRFLCCDACPKAFHFTCVDPPMDDSDVEHLEGEWFCRECEHNRQTQVKNNKKNELQKRSFF